MPESGSGPGLLIEQEIFGVNASLRAIADLYAEEGYVCLVPDLFWRMEPGVDLGYDEADFAKAFEYLPALRRGPGRRRYRRRGRSLAGTAGVHRQGGGHGLLPRR